jgi:hypothetical protein
MCGLLDQALEGARREYLDSFFGLDVVQVVGTLFVANDKSPLPTSAHAPRQVRPVGKLHAHDAPYAQGVELSLDAVKHREDRLIELLDLYVLRGRVSNDIYERRRIGRRNVGRSADATGFLHVYSLTRHSRQVTA